MAINIEAFLRINRMAEAHQARLVAVSKTKPEQDIAALYEVGHRIFGENYVQELVRKQAGLPADIEWHFIGHLQTNKVRLIAPFIDLIHTVDSLKLLREIHKQGQKNARTIGCLLQMHIAQEETKFGLDETELDALLSEICSQASEYTHVRLCGLMGMSTHTTDQAVIRREFATLKGIFDRVKQTYAPLQSHFRELSMGMSGDYEIALQEGSTLLRVGSLLFGPRQ
jgi:pyridoxal phosphate enzyme (YggS family)